MIFSSSWQLPRSSNSERPWLLPVLLSRLKGNKSAGPQFHLVKLFWPLAPISIIVSLSCHGKVAVPSRIISPIYKNLTGGQRVGRVPVGKRLVMFLTSPCTAASTCAMGNVQLPKMERGGYISQLTSQYF